MHAQARIEDETAVVTVDAFDAMGHSNWFNDISPICLDPRRPAKIRGQMPVSQEDGNQLDGCNYERYTVTMIRTFKHAGLMRYFETGNPRGLAVDLIKRIQIRLNVLNQARELRDIALPGFDFHRLKGDRKGQYAISVTGNYRLTFRFERGDVLDLDLEDYH
jgi:proteic killer suppression protein